MIHLAFWFLAAAGAFDGGTIVVNVAPAVAQPVVRQEQTRRRRLTDTERETAEFLFINFGY